MYRQRMFQLLRLGLVILSAILIYLIIKYAIPYIYPFLLAIILSFCLNPAVAFLEKTLKMPRGFAVFVILTFTISAIIGLIILIISELIHGTAYLADVIPEHFRTLIFAVEDFINEQLLPLYHNLASFFHTLSSDQQESINESITHFIQQFASFGTNILNSLLLQISQTLASLPGSITVLLFTIMAAFFMMKDWDLLVSNIKKMIPRNVLNTTNKVWNHLQNAFYGFMKAQLILIVITALTLVIGLLILQVDYALTIALFAALADILPFIGTGIIFIPWIIYLFLTGDYALTIALTTLYMVVIVQRQLLEPKIVSDSVGLNPLATLMGLFIGIQIWGAFGLLIGPFLVLVGNAIYQTGLFHQMGRFIKGS
ncbi:sporulation integral membrane protein YtvI [Lentibacillus sp. CBA3610]|uniref:sporulation integral membrane protein YtvI n=1 Tax=Lentibacillus sp. CBA3610 TaxID=2518176 RepID=UPI001595F7E9|nr:sporulation integral membrane protein YtvI [Lentibacillus sp. CBA3610]QKY69661.1 sporulation integral membrane protein YtvI [Lentibacillus sp. CBA3610]